uniref:Threonylcarbamoyl-AMP synthase n=1 Tax=Rattus norvegicus TaxID=10116 RepID=Q811U7_RAT|nr:BmTCTP receptor [Rattus norvegicus]
MRRLLSLACSASCSAALSCVYRGHLGDAEKAAVSGLVHKVNAYRYCQVRVPRELLEDLFPGPVTLVMERSEELNKDLNPFTPLVGIRIPDHAFMLDLAQMFGGPLALTSANLSSQARDSSLLITNSGSDTNALQHAGPVENLIRMGMAGLILVVLGILIF